MSFKVTIAPEGKEIQVDSETNMLEALKQAGIYIKSSCGGHASCSDCKVKITSGEDHLQETPFEETQLLGNVFHITKERLACQTKVCGDITLDISAHDEDTDREKIKTKSKPSGQYKDFKGKTKVRKKEEISEIMAERAQGKVERQEKQKKWFKHWEAEEKTHSKQGGFKKPQLFNTDIDYDAPEPKRENSESSDEKKPYEKKPYEKKDDDKKSPFPRRKKSDS
tara:strand:+ start:340269 stop:340940 length:672 start_codon:yes stop_codon:yes gene_type:complete